MHLSGVVLEKLPFPYYFIDENFKILSSSIQSEEQIFTRLINQKDFELFHLAFFDKNVFDLYLKIQEKYTPYRVYKILEENKHCHLFCFPVESESEQLRNTVAQAERRFLQTSTLLSTKQTKPQEIHEVTLSSDYLANVGKLAAGIAHEIRNPLTTVKGFIQLLKPYLSDIGKEQYANIALAELNRANDLIFEFLDAAKPREHKKENLSLNKIVKEISMLYESEAILRNVELETKLSEVEPIVFADAKQLKQVLVNLLKNALEAIENHESGEVGRIQISVEIKESASYIVVKDNGCGMTNETIENLFMPFYSTKQTGTGIGLPICKKIIEEHEGQIHINSLPGKGTIFKIELPLLS
ncbi:GHKL domain-containing protein [Bacillus sp. FJAT-29790]|uniref:ATP-binding protein n=1 Tax=Bacillus sp. FJAT-29790 TaxID=1895002 RepID=UPI001C22C0B9|nr:ATP-binding protein [Bacillus sp. FJAT-29790]MBU8878586.1 GHKL domain-containing protein [Bacillus sp. FJAT-29790]